MEAPSPAWLGPQLASSGPLSPFVWSLCRQAVSQSGELVQQCIKAACEAVLSAHDELNALDAKVLQLLPF